MAVIALGGGAFYFDYTRAANVRDRLIDAGNVEGLLTFVEDGSIRRKLRRQAVISAVDLSRADPSARSSLERRLVEIRDRAGDGALLAHSGLTQLNAEKANAALEALMERVRELINRSPSGNRYIVTDPERHPRLASGTRVDTTFQVHLKSDSYKFHTFPVGAGHFEAPSLFDGLSVEEISVAAEEIEKIGVIFTQHRSVGSYGDCRGDAKRYDVQLYAVDIDANSVMGATAVIGDPPPESVTVPLYGDKCEGASGPYPDLGGYFEVAR